MSTKLILVIEVIVLLLLLGLTTLYGQVVYINYQETMTTDTSVSSDENTSVPSTEEDELSDESSEPTEEDFKRLFAELQAMAEAATSTEEDVKQNGESTDEAINNDTDIRTPEEDAEILEFLNSIGAGSDGGSSEEDVQSMEELL